MSNAKTSNQVEAELKELSRKYKIMEGTGHKFTAESKLTLKKQQKHIEKLKKENDFLKEQLAAHQRTLNGPQSADLSHQVNTLNDMADALTRKIELENRKIMENKASIAESEQKIRETRERMGGVNISKENTAVIEKQVKVLENRLDKALIKFNQAIATNKDLRDMIDNLRREKVVFDNIYKKMERELHEKKQEMADVIEVSNVAFEERDQAVQELENLKQQAQKEFEAFETQFKELDEIIERDRELKEKLKQKEKERKDREVLGDSLAEEESPKKRAAKGNWNLVEQKAKSTMLFEKLQQFEDIFDKIKQATGITKVDELVNNFINSEDQNFSLFTYVNELNNEIEKLEELITDLASELEKHKGQGASTDNQRKKMLKELEEKLSATELKSQQFEQKFAAAMRTISSLKSTIQTLFTDIGCDPSAISELTGNTGVTESNIMQYLGVIEQRTNELLQMYAMVVAAKSGAPPPDSAAVVLLSVSPVLTAPQSAAVPLDIVPPSTGDDDEEDNDDDDVDHPLSREELKMKTLKKMEQRQGKGLKQGDNRKSKRKLR